MYQFIGSRTNPIGIYLRLLVLFFSLPALTPAYAQLKGQVQDQAQEPLPFANVLILTPSDSSLVKGVITNETGQFIFSPVPSGNYLLAISTIGYQTHYSSVNILSGQPHNLGILILQESAKELGEVVIRGQQSLYEQQADRLVIHVKNSITSAGGTVLDMLEKSPGVAVNRQNGSIALQGKEGVGVMINGKLTRMPVSAVLDMLRGMNGSSVEKIELIAQPSASYDAEGSGGLINIILQQNTDYGTNGNLSLTGGYGYGEKTGLGLTLQHRQKRITWYGDYSFFRDRTQQLFDFYRTYEEPGKEAFTSTESDRRATITNHTARLGFDYSLRSRTVLGGLIAGYTNKWQMQATNQTFIQNPTETNLIQVDNTETNHWQHLMGNLNLAHTFATGKELRLDVDYLGYHDTNPSDYANQFINERGELLFRQLAYIRKKTPIHMKVAKMDYQHTFSKNISFEAGIKGASSRFTNDVQYTYQQGDEWITDPALTQKYRLKEDILAAYTTWQLQVSSKTKLVTGLRYEYTDANLSSETKQGIVARKYGNWFPNVVVSHNLGKQQAIQLSYGSRINRPTFNDLAPFVIFYGPNNYESGNPALQPSLAHSLTLQYQWKEWITSLQYSHENNPIVGYQPHINLNTQELFNYAENLKQAKSITFSLLFPWQLTPWWNMQYTLLAMRHQVWADYLDVPEQLTNHMIRLNTTQRLALPLGISLEVSGYYQSPSLFGLYQQRVMGVLTIGVQKKLGKAGNTLSLTCDDVFWTTPLRWKYDRPGQFLQTDARFTLAEPRIVKLTYSHSFGNKKIKPLEKRSSGSEEEQQRVH